MTTVADKDIILQSVCFDGMCRTCLCTEEENNVNIFKTKFDGIGLCEIINSYIAIHVEKNDNLPQNICRKCSRSIIKMYTFIQHCEKSEAYLQNILKYNRKSKKSTKLQIPKETLQEQLIAEQLEGVKEVKEEDLIVNLDECDPLADIQHPETSIQSNEEKEEKTEENSELTQADRNSEEPEKLSFSDRDSFDSVPIHSRRTKHPVAKRQPRVKCNKILESVENKEEKVEEKNMVKQETVRLTTESNESKAEIKGDKQSDVNLYLKTVLIKEESRKQFSCGTCDYVCGSSSILRRHKNMKHPKFKACAIESATVKCMVCEKRFLKCSSLSRHMAMHEEQVKKYSENLSKKDKNYLDPDFAIDPANLREYLLKSNKHWSNIYSCNHCDKFCTTRVNMMKHQESVKLYETLSDQTTDDKLESNPQNQGKDTRETVQIAKRAVGNDDNDGFLDCLKHVKESDVFRLMLYWCNVCIKFFDSREQYLLHKKEVKHIRSHQHSCPICGKRFNFKSKVKLHMRCHTNEKPYHCKICNVAFGFNGTLKRHMKIHTGEKPHVCEVCGKAFIQLVSLQQHTLVHSGEYAHLCSYCGKQYKYRNEYAYHLQTHQSVGASKEGTNQSDKKAKTHQCNICPKMFCSRQRLKTHLLIHGDKRLLCNYCGKGFAYSSLLNSHIKSHTGDRPYSCTVCYKKFSQKNSVVVHMRCHTGEKPFHCKICAKSFKLPNHLRYHMTCVHSNVKAFKCQYCGKCFALKSTLTQHIRIHTGETPFVCNVCGKGFYHCNNMKKHTRIHGKVNTKGVKTDLEKKKKSEGE